MIVAEEDIAAGAEVFDSYGAKPNDILLTNYGFLMFDNKDDVLRINFSFLEDDPLAGLKKATLDLPPFVTTVPLAISHNPNGNVFRENVCKLRILLFEGEE